MQNNEASISIPILTTHHAKRKFAVAKALNLSDAPFIPYRLLDGINFSRPTQKADRSTTAHQLEA
jgi:hypothetical protein